MKIKKHKKTRLKKSNISLRRKLLLYYGRFRLVLKILVLSLLFLFIFSDFFKSYKDQLVKFLYTESVKYGFGITTVEIEGQKNSSVGDIVSSIGVKRGESVFSVNLSDVKTKLEENTWIKSAIVERKMPSTIYVAVSEVKPIAIWQYNYKLFLIDSEGNKITNYEKGFNELLHVVGQDANIYAANLIEELNQFPHLERRVKSAIRHGQRRWDLNFDDEFTVKMPEKSRKKGYEYLAKLHKKDKLFGQKYKMIDLRNSSKYYVEKY